MRSLTSRHHCDLPSCARRWVGFRKCHSLINTTLKPGVDIGPIPWWWGREDLVFICTQACNYLAASPHGLNHSCHTHIVLLMSMWIFWLHSAPYNYMRARVNVRKSAALSHSEHQRWDLWLRLCYQHVQVAAFSILAPGPFLLSSIAS